MNGMFDEVVGMNIMINAFALGRVLYIKKILAKASPVVLITFIEFRVIVSLIFRSLSFNTNSLLSSTILYFGLIELTEQITSEPSA